MALKRIFSNLQCIAILHDVLKMGGFIHVVFESPFLLSDEMEKENIYSFGNALSSSYSSGDNFFFFRRLLNQNNKAKLRSIKFSV